MHTFNSLLALNRLHFLGNLYFCRLGIGSRNLIFIVIFIFLIASLLFLSNGVVASQSRLFLALECSIKSAFVFVVYGLVAAVRKNLLLLVFLFELFGVKVEVTIVPVSLGKVVLCDDAKVVAH
jgi:hypothetical protein